MSNIAKVFCILSILFVSVSLASASVGSEMKRYDTANVRQLTALDNNFKCQYSQFAGLSNVVVISDSANFETSNVVRHFEVLSSARLKLTDYRGRTETVSVRALQNKYECYMFAKAPAFFDTSGKLSANFVAMRV